MTGKDERLPQPLGDDWFSWDPFDLDNYPFGKHDGNEPPARTADIKVPGNKTPIFLAAWSGFRAVWLHASY